MIILEYDNATQRADLVRDGGNIQTSDLMNTAVLISLFTRRRAEPTDVLPDPLSDDRMGWWADPYAENQGDLIGSRLWLLRRSKTTQAVVNKARTYAQEALQWFVVDEVAKSVAVETERYKDEVLAIRVEILRATDPVSRWKNVWLAHLEQL